MFACNFIKKETVEQVFSCEFYKNFKNTFFTEHLRATAIPNVELKVRTFFSEIQLTNCVGQLIWVERRSGLEKFWEKKRN